MEKIQWSCVLLLVLGIYVFCCSPGKFVLDNYQSKYMKAIDSTEMTTIEIFNKQVMLLMFVASSLCFSCKILKWTVCSSVQEQYLQWRDSAGGAKWEVELHQWQWLGLQRCMCFVPDSRWECERVFVQFQARRQGGVRGGSLEPPFWPPKILYTLL